MAKVTWYMAQCGCHEQKLLSRQKRQQGKPGAEHTSGRCSVWPGRVPSSVPSCKPAWLSCRCTENVACSLVIAKCALPLPDNINLHT